MIKRDVDSSASKKCAVCGRKTPKSVEYGYVDGISISIPVCQKCKEKTGLLMYGAMNTQLKSIAEFVRMSTVITCDENKLSELYKKERNK